MKDDGSLIKHMKGHENIAIIVTYSPFGNEILSGDATGHIIVWDGFTGDLIK